MGPLCLREVKWVWADAVNSISARKQNAGFRNGTPLSMVFGWYFLDFVIFERYETNLPIKLYVALPPIVRPQCKLRLFFLILRGKTQTPNRAVVALLKAIFFFFLRNRRSSAGPKKARGQAPRPNAPTLLVGLWLRG